MKRIRTRIALTTHGSGRAGGRGLSLLHGSDSDGSAEGTIYEIDTPTGLNNNDTRLRLEDLEDQDSSSSGTAVRGNATVASGEHPSGVEIGRASESKRQDSRLRKSGYSGESVSSVVSGEPASRLDAATTTAPISMQKLVSAPEQRQIRSSKQRFSLDLTAA